MRHLICWTGSLILLVFGSALVSLGKSHGTGSGHRLGVKHKDFELQPDSDLVVRTEQPPVKFDEKGKVQKYTPAELKLLKGSNPKLPGYASDYSQLKQGQVVKVYLARKKSDKGVVQDPAIDKADKNVDPPTYELAGVLTKVKSTSKSKKLTVRVETVTASGRGNGGGSRKEVITDKVTMIVIAKDPTVAQK